MQALGYRQVRREEIPGPRSTVDNWIRITYATDAGIESGEAGEGDSG